MVALRVAAALALHGAAAAASSATGASPSPAAVPSPSAPPPLPLAPPPLSSPPPLLLPDRSWFSQVARVRQRRAQSSPRAAAGACVAASGALAPGARVQGYELVERAALLGVCTLPAARASDAPPLALEVAPALNPWTRVVIGEAVGPVDTLTPSHRRCDAPDVCPLAPAPPLATGDGDDARSRVIDGPVLEYQYVDEDLARMYVDARYRLKDRFDAGSHGEVWKATRAAVPAARFVLKRLFLELGDDMVLMGLREAHFGSLLAGETHVARFVEYFFRPRLAPRADDRGHDQEGVDEHEDEIEDEIEDEDARTPEMWLVFLDEGMSLRHYLYEKQEATASASGAASGVLLQRSRLWEQMRADATGERVLREILRQLLAAVAALHARGITHRDIKPSNILLALPPAGANASAPLVKLADFGSAVDEHAARHLYPRGQGPTQAEETREYQPPEVLFSSDGRPYDHEFPLAYDLWSVGVVMLELVLGSPHVFLISPRAQAKVDAELRRHGRRRTSRSSLHGQTKDKNSHEDATDDRDGHKDTDDKAKAYLLHVLTREFCIFEPPPRQLRSLWDRYALVSESCHFGRFRDAVVARDPLRKGLSLPFALDLAWKLLQWAPRDRISARDALQHAFFRGAYVCQRTGRRFATDKELRVHERYLRAQLARDHALALVVRERVPLPGDDIAAVGRGFSCPQCRRSFATVAACEQHMDARRHFGADGSKFCAFDAHHVLEAVRRETNAKTARAFVDEALRGRHEALQAGMALFQGRKKYMEDVVLVQRAPSLRLGAEDPDDTPSDAVVFAVSDGHLGAGAATFALEHLVETLTRHFRAIPPASEDREQADKMAMRQTFLELHARFLASSEDVEEDASDDDALFSGCTLTVAVVSPSARRVVSANVGDSRAIGITWSETGGGVDDDDDGNDDNADHVTELSMDHWPDVPSERARIESSGGFVRFQGLWRVVGQLAVSRSLGDRHLRRFVTAEPSVFHLDLSRVAARVTLVIATDGLWESLSTRQVARYLREREGGDKSESDKKDSGLDALAADLVTQSYVRGGLDNAAVLLVRLSAASEDRDGSCQPTGDTTQSI